MEQQSDTTTSIFIDISTNDTAIESTYATDEIVASSGHNLVVRSLRYGRWWVLKGLKPEFRHQRLYIAALHKEFDILVHLQHPNVVSAFSWEEVKGFGPCIVMEWVDGVTLKEWLSEHHTYHEKVQIFHQLLSALEYIHGQQVAHRDLKPSNVMVTRNGSRVKLIDFGVSDTDSHTFLKQPSGTADYMSPQQCTEAITDQRNDLYSLGCVVEKMKMGWVGRHIARRCKASLEQRYGSVGEIMTDWQQQRRLMRIVRWLPLLIIVLVTLWMMIGKSNENKRNLPEPQVQYPQKEEIRPAVVNVDTSSVNLKLSAVTRRKNAESSVRITYEQVLEQSKKDVDEGIRESGIVQRFDTLTARRWIEQDFADWIDATNLLVNNVEKTYSEQLSAGEINALHAHLLRYTNETYYVPLSEKLMRLP
ncbi:MAG: serine/threonine protein kinase [Prevotellaceae bacterium]|nr:serine/threonine protein kinase [Prevotellaceae bacterium]